MGLTPSVPPSRLNCVGGPILAAHAIRAGIADDYHLSAAPVVIGGGKPCLPADMRVMPELLDQRRFDNGMIHLRYRARTR